MNYNIKSRFVFGEPWKFLDVCLFVLVIKVCVLLISLPMQMAENRVVNWPMTAVVLFAGTLVWAVLVWSVNWIACTIRQKTRSSQRDMEATKK